MGEPLRVLFVEDSPDDFDLERRALQASGFDLSAARVETAEDMRAALDEASWDLVIADYSLPKFNAVAALDLLKSKALDIPFIIVSGTIHEDTAVAAMRGGARDYLMKNNLARLGPAVGRELREAAGREARRKAERLALAGLQDRIRRLIEAYRERGHLRAEVDPLGFPRREDADLALSAFALGEENLDMVFATGDLAGPPSATLREIIARLEATYCRTIGVEFTHVENPKMRMWLQERMESSCNHVTLGRDEQLRLLSKLTDAEMFERFLHVKYVGAKRFSLRVPKA
jgi:CheY-like chemotaxis protein